MSYNLGQGFDLLQLADVLCAVCAIGASATACIHTATVEPVLSVGLVRCELPRWGSFWLVVGGSLPKETRISAWTGPERWVEDMTLVALVVFSIMLAQEHVICFAGSSH